MVKRSIINRNRLIRSRGTGLVVIAIMGFLIAGFVFQPAVSQIPFVAPNIDQLKIDFPDVTVAEGTCEQEVLDIIEANPDIQPPIIDPCDQFVSEEEIAEILDMQPNFNVTISSDDPPLKQLGDLVNDTEIVDAILPQSDKIGLLVEVTTIDSNGTRTIKEFRQGFTPLAFFGDPFGAVDLTDGSLEFRMWVETDPDTTVTGSGAYALNLIHHIDRNLPQDKIDQTGLVTVSGQADQNGLVTIEFVDITGQKSNVFTFDFTPENIDLFFPLNSRGLINFDISNFKIQKDFREDFEIASVEIFSIEIINSEDAVIFQNIDGTKEVILPSDNKLTISSVSSIVLQPCSTGICQYAGLPRPAVGSITVVDSSGLAVAGSPVFAGSPLIGSGDIKVRPQPPLDVIDINLVRGETYTIIISEPTPITFSISSPLSQTNFSYSCMLTGTNSASLLYGSVQLQDVPIICNFPFNNTDTITFEDGAGEFGVGARG